MKLRRISALHLAVLYLLAAAGVVIGINVHLKSRALQQAREQAVLILNHNMALHRYMNEVLKPSVLAALETGGKAPRFDPAWMASTYAVREIEKVYRSHRGEGYAYKECAVNARNPENEADPLEAAFIARLNTDPTVQSISQVHTIEGRPFLTAMHRGLVIEAACLRCHGSAGEAPPGLVERYGDRRGFGRVPGETASALSIRIPLAIPYHEADVFSLQLCGGLLSVLLALYLLQEPISNRLIFRPLEGLREKFALIASDSNHLGEEIPEPAGEELSSLARSFNVLSSNLRRERDRLEETIATRTAELRESNARLRDDFALRGIVEEELRTTRERLRTIVNNVPMVLVALDRQGRIVLAKGKVLEGIDRQSLYGQSLPERFGRIPLLREDAPPATMASAFRSALDGEVVSGAVEIAGRCYDCRLLPLSGEGGAEGVLGLAFDVTERRDAEERLRENEQSYRYLSAEFRALLDGIPDSLTLIDQKRIVWANRGTLSLLALEKNPAGERCRDLFLCREGECESCPVERSLASGQKESGRLQTPDGRVWGVKTFPLPDGEGQRRRVIRLASDITEQVRMQENAARSSRLASLGELAAGVAHEINNPNGLILLNAALLRDVFADLEPILEERYGQEGDFPLGGLGYRRLREDLPHLFRDTLDASQRIRRIVEELKNFARHDGAEGGEDIDLNACARTAARIADPVLARSTAFFSMDLAQELPPLRGNAQRLEQVVVNLLMNACQALPDRSRKIVLSTRFDGGAVCLAVHDEGNGIPPELLPRITDPFFTTRRESGGTGLGLSISARIVKEHGGELHFDSPPGSGTTVTFRIPLPKERYDTPS